MAKIYWRSIQRGARAFADIPESMKAAVKALALADDKAYPVLHSTVRVLTQAALQAASDSDLRETLWAQWRERI